MDPTWVLTSVNAYAQRKQNRCSGDERGAMLIGAKNSLLSGIKLDYLVIQSRLFHSTVSYTCKRLENGWNTGRRFDWFLVFDYVSLLSAFLCRLYSTRLNNQQQRGSLLEIQIGKEKKRDGEWIVDSRSSLNYPSDWRNCVGTLNLNRHDDDSHIWGELRCARQPVSGSSAVSLGNAKKTR